MADDRPLVSCAVLDIRHPRADDLVRRAAGSEPESAGREAHQRRHRLAHALLHDLLDRELGPRSWRVTADTEGKLQLTRSDGAPGGVSLTHGGRLVGAALSRTGAIGLDIEPHDAHRNVEAAARYAFGAAERTQVAAGGLPAFYRIWTLREAIGKATGQGLALATDGIDRIPPEPAEGCWADRSGDWLLLHRYVGGASSLAIALHVPGKAVGTIWTSESVGWDGLDTIATVSDPSVGVGR